MSNLFKPGQRWISSMEPDLGLGIVVEADSRTVWMRFPASECERRYAIASAPLMRVRFSSGDTVKPKNGGPFTVERVDERDGIRIYIGGGIELAEQDLSDSMSFTSPKDRLLAGFLDSNSDFDLRMKTLDHVCSVRKSPVRGFLGARIDLIPHQIFVASEVTSRALPRILLSDEPGLGKTIEACLVLRRLLLTGRIARVLILVPEALIHQWFVELLRKFNLLFRMIDKDFCVSVENSETDVNPFLNDPLCLCGIPFLVGDGKHAKQAVEAEWDMVVVDEAHHLTEGSPANKLVHDLGSRSPGLMLLTATPEQLGHRSHFARLRLLDPARYHNFEEFENEEKHYRETADLVQNLLDGKTVRSKIKKDLTGLPKDIPFPADGDSRKRIIENLLDRRGIGRVIYRNTRAVLKDFPKREIHKIPLAADGDVSKSISQEFLMELDGSPDEDFYEYAMDPRIQWLINLLKERKKEKILLICRSTEKVCAIDQALKNRTDAQTALFHEKLSLIQRDQNAARFARKDGVRILLCSEIGSEGRNFQFAHHLVLFDLPSDPELLEQRIGRLDRIGQKHAVHIYIPFIPGTPQEILVRWVDEGLDAFRKTVPGAYAIYQKLGPRIRELALGRARVEEFLEETKREREKNERLAESGRDRLLEMQSFKPETAELVIREIQNREQDSQFEPFIESLFESYGIRTENAPDNTLRIFFDGLTDPAFPVPLLREETLSATYDRNTAVLREDVEFLSWDHPTITGAMDLLLGSEKGNCTAALWPGSESNEILLEAVFVLECVASPKLHTERFLPPTPIRVMVNQKFEDKREDALTVQTAGVLRGVPPVAILQNPGVKALIPRLIACGEKFAEQTSKMIIEKGLKEMEAALQSEINRLTELKKVNPSIRDEEIRFFIQEQSTLRESIRSARLRVDALRLIVKT